MNLLSAIGNTPLVELRHLWNSQLTGVQLLVKLEGNNLGGSIKDRPAYYMLKSAIDSGVLTKEKTILEPTSGNTGIGMAMVTAALGYRIKLTMPACVSEERRAILVAFGAEIELTPGCDKTDGAIIRAQKIVDENPDMYFMPNQFANEANWRSHYETTAPEIYNATQGEVSAVVAGMGTTGTLMGCSKFFREVGSKTLIIGVEPTKNHAIQGLKNMDESINPAIYNPSLLNKKITCTDDDAFSVTRDLALKEGLFCGMSSGASVWAAMKIARDLPKGSVIVAISADRGDRYLSTELFRSVCALCPP